MKPLSCEHSRGDESFTVTARPLSLPRPVVVFAFHPLHCRSFKLSREPSQRSTRPVAGCSTPRLQLTTARICRSIGNGTVTVRVHCCPVVPTGSVHVALTVYGPFSPTLNACVTPR